MKTCIPDANALLEMLAEMVAEKVAARVAAAAPVPIQQDDWMTTRAAAKCLRREAPTLEDWRRKGIGPRFYQQGRRVRYRRSDLDSWMVPR